MKQILISSSGEFYYVTEKLSTMYVGIVLSFNKEGKLIKGVNYGIGNTRIIIKDTYGCY